MPSRVRLPSRDSSNRLTTAGAVVNWQRFAGQHAQATIAAIPLAIGSVDRDKFVAAFFFLALGGTLYLVGGLLMPYATAVVWAAILAVVFQPGNAILRRLAPAWPSLAAGSMTLFVFVVVVVPSLILSGILAREAVAGYQRLAEFVSSGRLAELNRIVDYWPISALWGWLQPQLESGEVHPTAALLSVVHWVSQWAARASGTIARNVVSFFVSLAIMLFALFFMFRDGQSMLASVESAIPLPADDRTRLIERLRQTILAVVQGLTVAAAVQGVLLAFGIWMVGMHFAVLLGTVTFVVAFLPIGGAALVWVPTAVVMGLAGEPTRAVIFAVYCLVAVSSIDNILKPILIGGQAQLSTPILFFGILGGLQAYGLLGLFLGPVILSTFTVLLGIYRERYFV